jgi:hypothetical protein
LSFGIILVGGVIKSTTAGEGAGYRLQVAEERSAVAVSSASSEQGSGEGTGYGLQVTEQRLVSAGEGKSGAGH